MVVLGSLMKLPPPDGRLVVLLGALLFVGVLLGVFLSWRGERAGLRRLSILSFWVAIAGFVVFQMWASRMAWEEWNRVPAIPGVVPALQTFDYPLHVSAFGLVWLLCAGLLASAMDHDLAKRKVGVVLCVLLFLGVSIVASLCMFKETYGFRSLSKDDVEWETKGVFVTTSHLSPMTLEPDVFPVARWQYPLDVLVPALVVLAGYGYLRRIRRVREALPHLDVPIETSHLAYIVLTSAILWGLARVLSVAQAVMLSSPLNPPSLVEETLFRETAAPMVASALGLLFVGLLPAYWAAKEREKA